MLTRNTHKNILATNGSVMSMQQILKNHNYFDHKNWRKPLLNESPDKARRSPQLYLCAE